MWHSKTSERTGSTNLVSLLQLLCTALSSVLRHSKSVEHTNIVAAIYCAIASYMSSFALHHIEKQILSIAT